MKQKLLMLLGAMMVSSLLWAAAPNSYVKFRMNGDKTPAPAFSKFSEAVPVPYNLGVVYRSPDKEKPNLGITGYQLVTLTDREGYEYEYSHHMLVYIGVYDNNINSGSAYFDTTEKGLFIKPTNSNTAVAFGQQFMGGRGASEPMNEVMSASQFVRNDGSIDDFVLPNPLVYDAQTNSYKEGQYQKGHSYVIAIHFTEVADWKTDEANGVNYWDYPQNSLSEYTSFNWKTDHSKECLLAGFTYAADDASTAVSVSMIVNGENKQYNLLGENQDPINLGTIYSKEVTLKNNQEKMRLPDLGFNGFIVESNVPVTYSAAAHTYGGSMTFTTLEKSVADEYIGEGFNVDNRDYKTGNFGRINSDLLPAILCAMPEGLVPLSENWAFECQPLDVWVNWSFSGTYPVNVGWAYDSANNGDFEDGKTYTVALYFSEYNENLSPVYIHRNGGKYYKFNFTYSSKTKEDALAEPEPVDPGVTITPSSVAKPGSAQTTETGVTVVLDNADEVDKEEGSVTFKTPVTSDAMKSLMETTTPGSADFLASFKGVYLMVAAGKGQVDVLLETAGGIEMTAMCGTTVLGTFSRDSKGLVSIDYDVPANTWILLFPTTKVAESSRRAPIDSGMRVYSLTNTQDMLSTPLTLEAASSGEITFTLNLGYDVDPGVMNPLEYQKNGGEWTTYSWNEAIQVAVGDKVSFRGNNATYFGNGTPNFDSHIICTADVYVYGNIMSLISSTDFASLTTLTGKDTFSHLFSVPGENPWEVIPNTTIRSHPTNELLLPATILTNMCYQYMFAGCQGLTRAPELPATEMTVACYASMFEGCTGLTKAPSILPCTYMTPYSVDETDPMHWEEHGSIDCYMEMFRGCTSLTEAPELPAIHLEHGVYQFMFSGCTSLKKAPVLPAAQVADLAYYCMFEGCTSLNYVKCLATEFLTNPDFESTEEEDVKDWLKGVSPTGTFVKADVMTSWQTGDSGIPAGWTVKNASEETDEYMAAETPLTIEATEDATTVIITNPLTLAIQYSTDGGNTWTTSSANPISISGIDTGKTVQLRGNNAAYSDGVIANSTIIYFDKDCYVYGNMMSLVSSMEFATATSLTANNTFYDLFDSNDHLKNHPAKELVLPATTLTEGCYSNLFYKCTALTKAPVLPATTLAPMCFKSMFSGCTALTDVCELPAMTMTTECYARMFFNCKALTMAPDLPATTMADYCYSFMFYGCNALTAAPALPATTMAPYCYSNMFGFCHALTATPALPATTLADYCYYRMFLGSNGLTTITSLPATTMAPYCYNEMFRQCQALTTGPTLPGTELADYCYRCMFQACTSLTKPSELPASTLARGCYLGMYVNTGLTEAPALPATTLAESCYYQMFQNNPNLVSSPVLPAAILPTTCYYKMFADCPALENVGDLSATTTGESSCEYMFMNCTGLVTAPALPATTLAPACYNFMFSGCSKLTKAPKLPAMTLASQCYQRMFEGCTSLVDAPALPASNLAELCYNDMFWECTALKNAPALPATTLADYCYTMMFLGCSSLEKAPDLPAATLTPGCYEHMFMNCKSLNYVKCLATDLGDETSTDGWLTNVSETGQFLKADEADWSVKGTTPGTWGEGDAEVPTLFVHGIPEGWTVQTDTETNIMNLKGNEEPESFFYDLNGRLINGKPVQKGIYILNGKKVAVK